MNKTVNINLASTFFHIDENAYQILERYLRKLKEGFKDTAGGEEILQDIEARIAELFQDLKTNPDYVINTADVEKVIGIMGEPETVLSEEDINTSQEKIHRKLYRDPEDKYIGGIAAGLGHYFKIDATWIRLIWLFLGLFSGGVFTLIYILFWILVPLAKTTGDLLRMKGEPVNIATIKKKIKEEFDDVTTKIKDLDYEKAGSTLKKKSKNFFQFLENLIRKIPSIILKLIGLLFLLISISSIFALFIGSFVLLGLGNLLLPLQFVDLGVFPDSFWRIALILVVLIPFIFLFSLGIRLLRGVSSRIGSVSRLVLFSLWIIAIGALVFTGTNQIRKNSITATQTTIHELAIEHEDTLRVSLFINEIKPNSWKFKKNNPLNALSRRIEKSQKLVTLSIKSNKLSSTSLEIQASAKGADEKKAQQAVEQLTYRWEQEGDILFLDDQIKNQPLSGFQTKNIEMTLLLKEGQIIALDESLRKVLSYPVENNQNWNSRSTAGYLWKMGPQELICLDCPTNQSKLEVQYQDAKGEEKVHLEVDKNGIQLKKE
ncbi:MAG: PspC domain-containing protein [Flavobacteriaceae bacterium]|jgi:phage shock protein PspC (stress-responsive transcriptional regulator)